MGVIYSSVDAEGYTPEKNGTLTLSGWRSSEDVGTIEMICLADETEISTVEISNPNALISVKLYALQTSGLAICFISYGIGFP